MSSSFLLTDEDDPNEYAKTEQERKRNPITARETVDNCFGIFIILSSKIDSLRYKVMGSVQGNRSQTDPHRKISKPLQLSRLSPRHHLMVFFFLKALRALANV